MSAVWDVPEAEAGWRPWVCINVTAPLAEPAGLCGLTLILGEERRVRQNHAIYNVCDSIVLLTPTGVISVSETSAAQVGDPLLSHIFLHQAVEHKNKEAWDRKRRHVRADYT